MIVFRLFMAVQMLLYRLTDGKTGGTFRGFKVLLLTTTGKKSGKRRTTPLGYIQDGDRYVLMGSNGGMDRHPAWYHNLTANPQVEVQVLERHMKAVASLAQGEERARLWDDFMEQNKVFRDYPKQTKRELPLVILTPVP
jgi:deazaflavin-dependent oxidoreductase (nitroreductase family)